MANYGGGGKYDRYHIQFFARTKENLVMITEICKVQNVILIEKRRNIKKNVNCKNRNKNKNG